MSRSYALPKFVLGALVVSGAVVLNVGIVRGDLSLTRYFELSKSRDVLRETVTKLEVETEAMQREIIKLKESPEYARKVLRDKYHETEENESIVFFAE